MQSNSMQARVYLLVGTDTDVGKTMITCALLRAWQQQGHATLGLKPVATGAERVAGQLRHADALALQRSSAVSLPYEVINPFCFAEPTALSIAAAGQGIELSAQAIAHACQQGLMSTATRVIIESAGGWYHPINDQQTLADLANLLQAAVILVVGVRLGCLNHAYLTYQAILASGLPLAGWVANQIEKNMPYAAENIAYLRKKIDTDLLASVPYLDDTTKVDAYFY